MFKKILNKFIFFLIFGILLIPNFSYGATLLTDDFTGTVVDTSKWTIIGTEGVDIIQNNTLTAKNNTNNGSKSLNSQTSFSRANELRISANISTSVGTTVFGYGNHNFTTAGSDAYYITLHPLSGVYAYIRSNGVSITGNTYCTTNSPGAKMSLLMTATGFDVYKNDILACSMPGFVIDNKSIFLQASGAGVFDDILVEDNIAFSAPNAISNLSASEWGNTTTNLTWSAPANGGDPITDYTVDYRVSGDVPWINFVDGVSASTGATVTGLTNGVTYEFRVRAINGIGTGPDSNIESVTVLAPIIPSTPNAPTASTILSIPGGTASIAFSPPSANGSTITSYTVTSSPGGIQASGLSSPIIISGLTNNTPYTFTITATNGVGTSTSSSASNSITPTGFPSGKIAWTEQTGSGQREWKDVAMSSDGVKLVAVNYNGYIYTSADSGVTWTEQTGSGQRYWWNVASSADGVKLVATNYGGYIYTSTDSGVNWTAQTSSGQRQWTDITSSSDGVYLVATATNTTNYYSSNSGANWSASVGESRPWAGVTSSSDGSIVYIAPENSSVHYSTSYGSGFTNNGHSGYRTWSVITTSSDGVKIAGAVDNSYIYTSINSGASSWVARESAGSRTWSSIDSSSNGNHIIASANLVLISLDGGTNWTNETSAGNWSSVAMSSDGLKVVGLHQDGYIYTGVVDIIPPTITNISSDKANGSYNTGEVIDIDVTFSEAVTSTGNVTVTLETGIIDRTCTFTVTNSTTGTCNYTVVSGDETSDLTVKTISGTINDQHSNAMTDFVPAINLAANKAIVIDTTSPTISEVTVVETPSTDTTPNYTFTTNEAGDITYGGSCTSATTTATSGNNTITFSTLTDGEYSDCTITVTDEAGNISDELEVTTFTIDTTGPVISEVTPVLTPATDTTPSYSFTTNEIGGITYGGSCSSSTNAATVGVNTITFDILAVGVYADCTVTVYDMLLNPSNVLAVTPFTITAPVVVQNEVTPPGAVSVVFLQQLSDRLRTASSLLDTGCAPGNLFSSTTGNKCSNNTNSTIAPSRTCPVLPSVPTLLRLNMNNDTIKTLQEILNCKGYTVSNSGAGSPGKETTLFGSKTREAVLSFQRDNELTADGIIGSLSRKILSE